MTRYYGWYASQTRGTRARLARPASEGRRLTAEGISVEEPVAITDPVNWSLRAAGYRWAELLRRIYEVEPLACPQCAAPMRVVAVISQRRLRSARTAAKSAHLAVRDGPRASAPPGDGA